MADSIQFKCIKKNNLKDPHERIHGIGGVNHDGERWYLPVEDAIAEIENDTWRFYTSINGKTSLVVIATYNGYKYLKTEADDVQPDNLLSLPECQ